MKLFALVLIGSDAAKKVKPPVGCDPAWLGEYEISTDCKRVKGFNTVPDVNGVLLENKSNWCRRNCKYGSLPETTYTQCKCKPSWSTGEKVFNCWYQIKLAKTVKGWVPFNHTDIEGNYPLDKWGEGGKQASCVQPTDVGTWGEWSQFGSCDASCGLGERKRTRECSTQYCGDEPSEESMKCLAYSDYTLANPHSCGNKKDWWQPHAMGNPFTYLNEGTHCLFPSFGRGWASETMPDGEVVQMGVECESGWNYDSHSIAPLNGNCKLVCRGSNGGQYLPKTSHWSNLQCLSPITVQWLDPSQPQGINDWMSQGLGMGQPWYFDRQTWPRKGCWPGCGSHKSLSDVSGEISKCYKLGAEPQCTDAPPLTDFEQTHNTHTSAISWSCTDGNKPGSVCTKTCVNNHLDHIGNANQVCQCTGDDCIWKRTDEYFHYAVYRDRPKSCIKGCDAQPKDMWAGKEYKLKCDQADLIEWSDSIDGDSIRYQWNHPTPVKVNNKCTVMCDDYSPILGYPREWQMEGWAETGGVNGGVDSFDIQCKQNSAGNGFEWVGDFKECIQVCGALGRAWQEGVDPIWTCTNDFFIGSVCEKSCPAGWKLDKNAASYKKTVARCRSKSYGSSWSQSHFKECIPE